MDSIEAKIALRLAHRELLQRIGRGWTHELRQPMAAIRNGLSVMRIELQTHDDVPADEFERWVDLMESACRRFDETLKQQALLLSTDLDVAKVGVSLVHVACEIQQILRIYLVEDTLQVEQQGVGDLGAIQRPQALSHLFALLFLQTMDSSKTAHIQMHSGNHADHVLVELKLTNPNEAWCITETVRNGFCALSITIDRHTSDVITLRWPRLTAADVSTAKDTG